MSTRYPEDPQDAIEVMHNLVGGLAWRFNHAGAGYLDRLDAAIGLGAKLADDSLPALQLAGGMVVYGHSYLTVAHPAMKAALPPTTQGFLAFAIYAAIFASMTGLIKRERKGKGD